MTLHERHTAMHTLPAPTVSDPPPPVPYFRALPEPDWRLIDAVAAQLGLPPAA